MYEMKMMSNLSSWMKEENLKWSAQAIDISIRDLVSVV